MRLQVLIAVAALQCCLLAGSAQSAGSGTSAAGAGATKTPKTQVQASSDETRGERAFHQNCSRCHNAPQELPRRITGTVLLHMRVRASLSAADERAILHYMAP